MWKTTKKTQKFNHVSSHAIIINAKISEAYSEHRQASKMERFAKIVNGFQAFTIFVESSI